MASGITTWSVEISYGCKKKNVNGMLGFLKKQKMSLVNLIIYIFKKDNPNFNNMKNKATPCESFKVELISKIITHKILDPRLITKVNYQPI